MSGKEPENRQGQTELSAYRVSVQRESLPDYTSSWDLGIKGERENVGVGGTAPSLKREAAFKEETGASISRDS